VFRPGTDISIALHYVLSALAPEDFETAFLRLFCIVVDCSCATGISVLASPEGIHRLVIEAILLCPRFKAVFIHVEIV
jgi:hypothetical protein